MSSVLKTHAQITKRQKLKWSHQVIINLLRSATNIFLMQTLGEYHALKFNMLDNEEYIIGKI